MQVIALQFDTPQNLYIFRRTSKVKVVRTDVTELVIYCECCQQDIDYAVKHYGARVKDGEKQTRSNIG